MVLDVPKNTFFVRFHCLRPPLKQNIARLGAFLAIFYKEEENFMLNTFLTVLNWVMLGLSIFGFARLIYYEKWWRAALASVLAGISLYMMLFFR
jgi:hypothetical protein